MMFCFEIVNVSNGEEKIDAPRGWVAPVPHSNRSPYAMNMDFFWSIRRSQRT